MLKDKEKQALKKAKKLGMMGERTNNFWARKYGVKEVEIEGRQTVADYIRNQKKDLHAI